MAFVKFTGNGRKSATGKPEYNAELVRGDIGVRVTRRKTGADMVQLQLGERGFVPSGTDNRGTAGT
jgi:hypothetical protein